MLHRKLTGFLVSILVVSLASLAVAGIPDPVNSFAELDPAAVGAGVFNLPNGQGAGFDEAFDGAGNGVDATVTLYLRDANDDAIVGYPFEDLALASSAGGLVACPAGMVADFSTDAMGMTEWQNAKFAGGYTDGETVNVYIAGTPLSHPGLNLLFNSADISGDLVVNLTDVSLFAGDFMVGPYNFRSDFVYDGSLNLSDVTLLAQGNGTSCP